MLNIPPHLEACRPRGLFSIFHGTSSPVARRCPRASDLVLSAEHAFLLYERSGLHLQSGASAVGGVLHGARRQVWAGLADPMRISIHAPRAGCDSRILKRLCMAIGFQSTHPVRGATGHDPRKGAGGSISIHAPRVGRDQRYKRGHFAGQISIHAPRVGRDLTRRSPPPAPSRISIHAPRVGRDHSLLTVYRAAGEFQSTRPVGARQDLPAVLKPVAAISIHAPHGRGGVSAGRPAGRCSHRP